MGVTIPVTALMCMAVVTQGNTAVVTTCVVAHVPIFVLLDSAACSIIRFI